MFQACCYTRVTYRKLYLIKRWYKLHRQGSNQSISPPLVYGIFLTHSPPVQFKRCVNSTCFLWSLLFVAHNSFFRSSFYRRWLLLSFWISLRWTSIDFYRSVVSKVATTWRTVVTREDTPAQQLSVPYKFVRRGERWVEHSSDLLLGIRKNVAFHATPSSSSSYTTWTTTWCSVYTEITSYHFPCATPLPAAPP